jgi:hypothetical protein
MSLILRRGTEAQRQTITFDQGEVIYTTDTQKLYVGDGATLGGKHILATSAGAGVAFNPTTQALDFSTSNLGLTSSNVSEGSNKYFTSQRAQDAAAALFTATGAPSKTGSVTGVNISGAVTISGTTTSGMVQGETFVVAGTGGNGLTVGTYYISTILTGTTLTVASTRQNAFNGVFLTSFTTGSLTGTTFGSGAENTAITFVYDSVNHVIRANVALDGVGINSLSADPAPTLGGNLILNSKNITGTGNINITGDITASGTLTGATLVGNLNIGSAYSIKGIGDTVVMSSASLVLTLGNATLPEMLLLSTAHTLRSQTSQTILNLFSSIGATPGSPYTANTDVSYVNFKAWSTSGASYSQVGTITVSVDGNIGGNNDLPGRMVFAVGGQTYGTQQYLALTSYGYLSGPQGLLLTALTNATTSAFAAGAAYLPAASVNGTIIYNSDAGSIQAYINGAFRNFVSYSSSAPTSSKGAAGDRKGMVFATSAYVYTCYADYTNGIADIWARTATTGSAF